MILKWLEGNIIPAQDLLFSGFCTLLEPKRAGMPPLLGYEEFLKTKKRQQGCRTPSIVSYKTKYATGYWKVKENFLDQRWAYDVAAREFA